MSGGNVGVNPPTGVTRPVKIHLDQNLEYVGDDEVRLTGSARLSLSEHYDGDEGDVEVSVSYRFVEDERLGASCPINVEAPDGFQVQEGSTNKFEGTLVRDEKAIFKFETDAYSSTWTARLIVNADVVEKNDEGQNP
jgi:hypothetical protein